MASAEIEKMNNEVKDALAAAVQNIGQEDRLIALAHLQKLLAEAPAKASTSTSTLKQSLQVDQPASVGNNVIKDTASANVDNGIESAKTLAKGLTSTSTLKQDVHQVEQPASGSVNVDNGTESESQVKQNVPVGNKAIKDTASANIDNGTESAKTLAEGLTSTSTLKQDVHQVDQPASVGNNVINVGNAAEQNMGTVGDSEDEGEKG